MTTYVLQVAAMPKYCVMNGFCSALLTIQWCEQINLEILVYNTTKVTINKSIHNNNRRKQITRKY